MSNDLTKNRNSWPQGGLTPFCSQTVNSARPHSAIVKSDSSTVVRPSSVAGGDDRFGPADPVLPLALPTENEPILDKHVFEAYESDRALLAYEIHDGMVQHATGARMHLQTLLETDSALTKRSREEIKLSLGLIDKSIAEARHLMRGLRPPELKKFGIVAALRHMVDHLPDEAPAIEFQSKVSFSRLEPLTENTLFRITQESITNATRYSQSHRIMVCLSENENAVRLEIRDWGVGFDQAQIASDSFGLQGMRDRARLLGGRTTIESKPGEGTRIFVELPITRPAGK